MNDLVEPWEFYYYYLEANWDLACQDYPEFKRRFEEAKQANKPQPKKKAQP